MSTYREAFAKRMAMAGLKPHHRIAIGVSGGPDSMALCVLAAGWKSDGLNAASHMSSGFIGGLLAIVVDHGFRAESKHEASIVCRRVMDMGIKCEIAHCEWSNGKPNQGHLQEAARDKRYQILQDVCVQHLIGVLLIAHHADDQKQKLTSIMQAELFILRLSRGSGVLGLAGMAFTSQLFTKCSDFDGEASSRHGILLVRPLLEYSKGDMYKICQGGDQEWVEDPTNQSALFARNRIRMSLKNLSSAIFNSELQAVISACRRTRLHVDQICRNLLNKAVTVMPGAGRTLLKETWPQYNKCAVDFLYMIHILIRESTFEYDMRCALVPVGITKFSKLIERATEFKENTPAETQPLPDHQAYYSLNLPTASANIATAETEDDVEEENLPIQPSSTSSVSPSPSLPAPSHLSNRPLPDLNLPPAPSPEPAPPAPLSAEEEQDLLTKREQVKRELRILLRIGYDRRGRNEKNG
ncbi:unnamed protein product [Ilex paraguariensis]|uniref:tRNA(Ile)-lysidine synthetase n=1 Tax=Ilex paraguariensis TaxID=185542 RepID=A0ABC8V153_9AQUA